MSLMNFDSTRGRPLGVVDEAVQVWLVGHAQPIQIQESRVCLLEECWLPCERLPLVQDPKSCRVRERGTTGQGRCHDCLLLLV